LWEWLLQFDWHSVLVVIRRSRWEEKWK